MKMNVLLEIMPVMCLPHVTTLLVVTLVSAMKDGREMECIAQVMNYFYKQTFTFKTCCKLFFYSLVLILSQNVINF